ncbi:MAG TPA: hypothetical protein VM492_13120 [Sumerlaeia bacterium]|nr:hypothetical protein [Sumerlaeia bacterium]
MLRKPLLVLTALAVVAGTAYAGPGKSTASAKADPNNPDALKERVVKVLRTTNKAQLNRYVPKVYNLKNVNPATVAFFVMDAVSAEEGLVDTFASPEGNSGALLVCVPEYMLPSLDALVSQLDRPELNASSGTKWAYVQLKHRSCLDLGFLDSVLQYGAADNTITPDVGQNALFLMGAPSGADALLAAIQNHDAPTRQVSVSARIYEIEVTNDGTLGVDFHAWKNGPGRALFSLGAFGEYEKIDYVHGAGQGLQFDSGSGTWALPQRRMNSHGYNGAYYYDLASAFFDFLVVKGKGEVLTDSSVTVLNRNTANFASSEEILYYAVSVPPAATGADPAGILPITPGQQLMGVGNVNDRQVTGAVTPRQMRADQYGVFLSVTPCVAAQEIDLGIATEVSDYLGFDDAGMPLINRRQLSTTIRVKDGEEIVIGGLTREREVKASRKIPVLGSIPVLGWLFGGEITTKKNAEVVEAVTVSCIEDCGSLTPEQEAVLRKARGKLNVEAGTDEYGYKRYLIGREKYEE